MLKPAAVHILLLYDYFKPVILTKTLYWKIIRSNSCSVSLHCYFFILFDLVIFWMVRISFHIRFIILFMSTTEISHSHSCAVLPKFSPDHIFLLQQGSMSISSEIEFDNDPSTIGCLLTKMLTGILHSKNAQTFVVFMHPLFSKPGKHADKYPI